MSGPAEQAAYDPGPPITGFRAFYIHKHGLHQWKAHEFERYDDTLVRIFDTLSEYIDLVVADHIKESRHG